MKFTYLRATGSRSDLGDYLTAPEVAGGAGYGDVRVSNDLIDLYDATDVRLTGLTKTNSKYPGYRWSTKYPGKNGLLAYNNVPVLRISEMYLIRSEAIYRGATVSGVTAIDDLNRVATNRNAEAYATVTARQPVRGKPQRVLVRGACILRYETFAEVVGSDGLRLGSAHEKYRFPELSLGIANSRERYFV